MVFFKTCSKFPAALAAMAVAGTCFGQDPALFDQNLGVRTALSGLNQPIGIAFLGPTEYFVIEKASGQVKHVVNGAVTGVALDLAVNSASERGLLGMALHPSFPAQPYVYLFWSQSSTGGDSAGNTEVFKLSNRVDRFVWDGFRLTHDRNIMVLRSFQWDPGQPARGNHDGGVIRFGPPVEGRPALYVLCGDLGRRGWMQNNLMGPVPDDPLGGPKPDNLHLSGCILRVDENGVPFATNPFFSYGALFGDEYGRNLQKLYAYGIRNGFGMVFDHHSGLLWTQEHGDDSFDEINRVDVGSNGGWVQIMGPVSRIQQYKQIEVDSSNGLQQLRWPPQNIADTPDEALARLFRLPNASYHDPEFSWKFAVAPAGIAFVRGNGLGAEYEGDLLVGASRLTLENGYLMRFKLKADRSDLDLSADQRLADRVADNAAKFDPAESESLIIGRNFGVVPEIATGPNGNVYCVSLSNGAIYEIFRR